MVDYRDYRERNQSLNWKVTKYCVQKQEEPIPPTPSVWSEYVKVFQCNNDGTSNYGNETHKIHIDHLSYIAKQMDTDDLSPSELTPNLISTYLNNIKIIRTSDSTVNVLPYQQEQHTIKVFLNYPNATKFLIYKDIEGNCYGIYLKYIQLIKKTDVDSYTYTKIPKNSYTNCLDCLQPWEEAQAPCWGDHHFFFGPTDLSNVFNPSFNIDDNSSSNQEELVWLTMDMEDNSSMTITYIQEEHPSIPNGYLIKNINIWTENIDGDSSFTGHLATTNGLVETNSKILLSDTIHGFTNPLYYESNYIAKNDENENIPYKTSLNILDIIEINIAYHINSSEDTCSAGDIEYLDLEVKPINYGFYDHRIQKIGGLFYYLLKEASEQPLGTLNNTSSAGFDGISDFLSENRSNFTTGGYISEEGTPFIKILPGKDALKENKAKTTISKIQTTYNHLAAATGDVDISWDPLGTSCRHCYSIVIDYNGSAPMAEWPLCRWTTKICATEYELNRLFNNIENNSNYKIYITKGTKCFSLLNKDCYQPLELSISKSGLCPDINVTSGNITVVETPYEEYSSSSSSSSSSGLDPTKYYCWFVTKYSDLNCNTLQEAHVVCARPGYGYDTGGECRNTIIGDPFDPLVTPSFSGTLLDGPFDDCNCGGFCLCGE